MDLDDVVARCRHDIDILTATFGSLTKTEIGTLVLVAHLDGQCDALESDEIMSATAEERADYVRMIRAVANKLQP